MKSAAAQLFIICAAIGCFSAACANGDTDALPPLNIGESAMVETDNLGQIITDKGELIMALEDVVGIGEGLCDGSPCIRVFLARENAVSIAKIKELLAGVPFAADISGEFLASPQ